MQTRKDKTFQAKPSQAQERRKNHDEIVHTGCKMNY